MQVQAVSRRRCASCERWRGERQPGATADAVLIVEETATGLCQGGPWDGSERRARSACGHWLRWSLLGSGEASMAPVASTETTDLPAPGAGSPARHSSG